MNTASPQENALGAQTTKSEEVKIQSSDTSTLSLKEKKSLEWWKREWYALNGTLKLLQLAIEKSLKDLKAVVWAEIGVLGV